MADFDAEPRDPAHVFNFLSFRILNFCDDAKLNGWERLILKRRILDSCDGGKLNGW